MKNNFIRVIGLVLALIMCLSATALVACEKEPSPEPPVSSGDASSDDTLAESTNPAEPEKATISVESLNNYYVVRPDVNNEELVASVMAFEKNLEAKLSVETKGITTDSILFTIMRL